VLSCLFFTSVLGAAALAAGIGAGTTRRNGGVIAFTRTSSLPPRQIEIDFIGADGRRLRPLRTGVVPSWEPEWSRDGRWIVFRGGRTDDLYLIRPDGSGVRQLTRDRADEQSPAWSPDGAEIAYVRYASPGAPSSIWVLTVGTGSIRRLTRDSLGAGTPSWSPNGSQIAVVSQTTQHGYEPELG
jgi:Tol biopolymer transport system component